MRGAKAKRSSTAILLIVLLLLAACGSTVQQPQGVAEVTGDELGDLSSDAGALPPGAHRATRRITRIA